jgi:hypothetical protein
LSFVPRTLVRSVASLAVLFVAACGDTAEAPTAPLSLSRAPSAPSSGPSRVLYWGDAVVEAIRVARPAPTVAARALAVVHTAIFDAWAAYDERAVGTRLGSGLRRPAAERTLRNKEEAISYAAHRALVDLFPAQKSTFDAKLSALGYVPGNTTSNTATPAGVGNVAAMAVLAHRHADGANQLGAYADVSGYTSVNTAAMLNDPARWQPLFSPTAAGPVAQKYATPHWGNVVPFALTSGRQFRPASFAGRWGTKENERQMKELIKLYGNLTDEDKAIAEYWADGPSSELPPGHWCVFAKVVSQRDRHSVDDDAKMYFVLANALHDAGIAAWDAKRAYDSSRPITQIRVAMRGQQIRSWGGAGKGTVTMNGENWMPYQPPDFVTPPFPEFVSGHSTFSGAASTVLAAFTGSDKFGAAVTIRAGSSRVEPGISPRRDVTLSWTRFSDAADQAGYSRLLGGIHFSEANEQGRRMGEKIGAQAWAKAQQYIRDDDRGHGGGSGRGEDSDDDSDRHSDGRGNGRH